jgi:hypothetical protein
MHSGSPWVSAGGAQLEGTTWRGWGKTAREGNGAASSHGHGYMAAGADRAAFARGGALPDRGRRRLVDSATNPLVDKSTYRTQKAGPQAGSSSRLDHMETCRQMDMATALEEPALEGSAEEILDRGADGLDEGTEQDEASEEHE